MKPTTTSTRISPALLLVSMLLLAILFVGTPLLHDWLTRGTGGNESWLSRLLIAAAKGFTVAYVFFVGSAIGSFVNVVAYRMPLGRSVVTGSSACPRCRKRIRGRDNIPVWGWILLGGRCRNCGLPISARYPLVEVWFGVAAMGLFLCEWITGAANVPGRPRLEWTGIPYTVWTLDYSLLGLFTYHFLLVGTVSTWALFKLDRNPLPWRAVAIPFLIGFGALVVEPGLLTVPGISADLVAPTMIPLVSGVLGFAAGFLLGWVLEWLAGPIGLNPPGRKGIGWGLGLAGAMIGWQAMLSAAMIFALLLFLSRFASNSIRLANGPLLALLAAAILIQVCFWQPFANLAWWPGDSLSRAPAIAGILFSLAVTAAGRFLVPGAELELAEFEGYGKEVPELVQTPVAVPRGVPDLDRDEGESGPLPPPSESIFETGPPLSGGIAGEEHVDEQDDGQKEQRPTGEAPHDDPKDSI